MNSHQNEQDELSTLPLNRIPQDIFNYNIAPYLSLKNAGRLATTCKEMKSFIAV